jgi:hypothetical protein|tara:strand:- start:1292 stop:2224 length:933 start_codon:yes stop_codon:yes gene_type:complete
MKKNVVWWVDFGNNEYSKYSKNTWKYWCDKNDCLFIEYDISFDDDTIKNLILEIYPEMMEYGRVTQWKKEFFGNWHRYTSVFDVLEKKKIEYDQICLVNSSSMIKWDTPNFFDLTNRKFTAWREMDNFRWVYESVRAYKEYRLFDDFELDLYKYIGTDFIIFNDSHKDVFQKIKEFYLSHLQNILQVYNIDNKKSIIYPQEVITQRIAQTPINYLLQINDIDIELNLSRAFKLNYLSRKDFLYYGGQPFGLAHLHPAFNWQLRKKDDESYLDTIPFYAKVGYVWLWDSIEEKKKIELMGVTWNELKENYK